MPTLKYFWLTLKHKWFVFVAGLRLGVPIWRLITHDLSKFSIAELPHYGKQFFGKADDPAGFIKCWEMVARAGNQQAIAFLQKGGKNE